MSRNKNRISPIIAYGVVVGLLVLFVGIGSGCSVLDPNPGPDAITGGSGGNGGTVVTPVDTLPATLQRGIDLWVEYCSRCHGDSAQGTLIWPANLQGRSGIHDQVRNGIRAMPSFPQISDSGIRSIELFLLSFQVDFGSKSDEELFMTFCGTCHGDSALGTATFPGSIQGHDSIADIVHHGRGTMAPVVIPDSLVVRIQRYLKSFDVDLSTLTGIQYYGRICASCHGVDGAGLGTRGPEIRNPVRGYATWVIQNGRVGHPWYTDSMPRYTTAMLSTTQLGEILTWLASASHPTTGQSLYNRFCSNCHGKDGRGGPSGKRVTGELDEVSTIVRRGHGGTNYAQRGDYMPKWSTSELSNAEVDAIRAYIGTLR